MDASCVWRWVQVYSQQLNKRCQPHLKCTNKSYRVDETYIKVKGQDKYLYRAVDSTGQTIDFLLTAKRNTSTAKLFFEKVFSSSSNPIPRVISADRVARCMGKLQFNMFVRVALFMKDCRGQPTKAVSGHSPFVTHSFQCLENSVVAHRVFCVAITGEEPFVLACQLTQHG
jgi:hypothetical protein